VESNGKDCLLSSEEGLCAAPILAYPKPREFIIETGASNAGIGEVLSQVWDSQERV
jgi:hypothetical protein